MRATERGVRHEWVGDGVWDAVERLPEPRLLEKVKLVIGGPSAIRKLCGVLASSDGQQASRLIEWIGRRCAITENMVVELTVGVRPAGNVSGWASRESV
jgi:hypothetical protein